MRMGWGAPAGVDGCICEIGFPDPMHGMSRRALSLVRLLWLQAIRSMSVGSPELLPNSFYPPRAGLRVGKMAVRFCG